MIGDGGFVFALEKRGYVKAGPWTPEATAEYPEAGENKLFYQIIIINTPFQLEMASSGVSLKFTFPYVSQFRWICWYVCLMMQSVCLMIFSATATQGVPEGRGQRYADLHLLRQWWQTGEQRQQAHLHCKFNGTSLHLHKSKQNILQVSLHWKQWLKWLKPTIILSMHVSHNVEAMLISSIYKLVIWIPTPYRK